MKPGPGLLFYDIVLIFLSEINLSAVPKNFYFVFPEGENSLFFIPNVFSKI